MTNWWSLFFVLVLVALNVVVLHYQDELLGRERGFGGPVGIDAENIESIEGQSAAFLGSLVYPIQDFQGSASRESLGTFFLSEEALFLGHSSPLSNVMPTRDGLINYKVLSGDTLSSIAARFGISINTIRWANPGLKTLIRPGQKLVILPVSGFLYQIKENDTLKMISHLYGFDIELFKKYNPSYQKDFNNNQRVVLPYAEPLKRADYTSRYTRGLPDLRTYFALPARGWNWGQLHNFNAVDIADSCGKPIYAAAEGLIIEAISNNRWNDGYGNYIFIEHPNGTKTRYSHNAKNLVSVGDYVVQGDQIALIGKTGNTHGPTGCHLHFEVYGARNPFAVR